MPPSTEQVAVAATPPAPGDEPAVTSAPAARSPLLAAPSVQQAQTNTVQQRIQQMQRDLKKAVVRADRAQVEAVKPHGIEWAFPFLRG